MSKSAHFKVDPRLAQLLGETYKTVEEAAKELIDNSGLDVLSATEFQEAADKVQAVLS